MTDLDLRSARRWALGALARRMHTAHEIREGLARRGFSDDVAGELLRELVQKGYVDDFQFATVWVTGRSVRRLHGRLRLLSDLRRKGVPEEVAAAAVRESLSREDELAAALKALERRKRSLRTEGVKGRAALHRHLRSRGFDSDVIRQAMGSFEAGEEPI